MVSNRKERPRMKNKSDFVRKHGFGVVSLLFLGVLGMCLFSIPAEAFSLPTPSLPKIPIPKKIPLPGPGAMVEIAIYASMLIIDCMGMFGDAQDS